MATITKVMYAEIVLLRGNSSESLDEKIKKDNLKEMIEEIVRYHTCLPVEVTFSSIPSQFLYSSNAIKMRASIYGASGALVCEKLIKLFTQPGLKAWFGFEPHLYVEDNSNFKKNYKPLLWAGVNHRLSELSFGCIVGLDTFMPHFTPECAGQTKCKFGLSYIKFQHDVGRLQIKLNRVTDLYAPYLFNLKYTSIKSIILALERFHNRDFAEWVIYLNLNFPPIVECINPDKTNNRYRYQDKREKTHGYDSNDEGAPDEEVEKAPHVRTRRMVEILESGKGKDVISRCNVIRLCLAPFKPDQYTTRSSWKRTWKEVRNIQLKSEHTIGVYFCGVQFNPSRLVLEPEKRFQSEVLDKLFFLNFDMLYALKCASEISFKLIDELDSRNTFTKFRILLEKLKEENVKIATYALFDLFYAIDSHEPVAICETLEAIFETRKKEERFLTLVRYENMCQVRRCILTPSRKIFLPPILHTKSRFLRDYEPEYALWVHLRDDDLNALAFTVRGDPPYLRQFFQEYIKGSLLSGMEIANRKYEFLGCSNSQLRDCGMFLYASDSKKRNSQMIRDAIGDIHKIRNPAKYLARFGQAFSQPMGVYKDQNLMKWVQTEPDILKGHHPLSGNMYNFTDGCGRISIEAAKLLSAQLDRNYFRLPSAYQIRLAGYKGLLAVDSRLEGCQIIMRKSMEKFVGTSDCVDVIKASAPVYAYLCKPLVNILNQKGVNSHTFLKLQADYLKMLTESYTCHCKAGPVLKSTRLGLPYEALSDSGIDILQEVFFRKGLDTVVKRKIHNVKEKARIELDHSTSRVMFGVPDVTGTLQPGQVFFQYSDEKNPAKPPTPVQGEVLITKFPCTHPGDVRKFTAMSFPLITSIPGLTDLIDVVVFPTTGERSHPNEMSGSDLDGDEYFITWNRDLIFPGPNTNAMDYPDTKTTDLNRIVNVEDMLDFYCQFVRDSGIGIISAAHLAISDKEGIFGPVCESLAHKCSLALDFAKTGESVSLSFNERPEIYPDFMEKEDKAMYQSNRALGHMYREIVDFRDFLEDIPEQESEGKSNVQLLTVNGWEKYRKSGKEAYEMYVCFLEHIQKMHSIADEINLVYDCFVKSQKYLCGKNENESIHDVCHRAVNDIIKIMNKKFYEEFEHVPVDQRTQNPECQTKASAWYLVTREMNASRRDSLKKFYLLPWIMSEVLIEIAKNNQPFQFQHVCQSTIPNQNETVEDEMNWYQMSHGKKWDKIHRDFMLWYDQLQSDGMFDVVDVTEVQLKDARIVLETFVHSILFQTPDVNVSSYSETFIEVMKQLFHFFEQQSSSSLLFSYLRMLVLFTLFRFYRMNETKNLWQVLLDDSNHALGLKVFSLSMRNEAFRKLVTMDPSPLKSKLRNVAGRGKIIEMVAKIHEAGHHNNDHCFVMVIGTKVGIRKLKNAITKPTFYSDILCSSFGQS